MSWFSIEEIHSLQDIDQEEWDSLCDGCGICCLYKVRSWKDGETHLTRVACRYLNAEDGTCRIYAVRFDQMPSCIRLTKDNIHTYQWLPETCAYRRIAESKPLPWWHYLRSGKRNLVHDLGISVRHIATSEDNVDMNALINYVLDTW